MASPKEVGEEPEMTCCSCCNMRTLFKCSTVVVLVFVNLLNYMDRYTIAGILPQILNGTTNGFNETVSETEGGLLQTVFIISFMVLGPVFGYLGDRYTRKYIMAIGLFLWTGFVLAGSFSVDYAMLAVTRCFVGVGEASYATIAPTILADLFSVEQRLLVLSVFYMAIPVGSALGYGVGAFVSSLAQSIHDNLTPNISSLDENLTQSISTGEFASWRWSFRVTPGLGLLAVVLILLLVKEPPRGHSDHHDSKGVSAESGVKGYLKDVLYLIRIKSLVLSTFGFAASTFAIGALAQWAPTYIYYLSQVQTTHYSVSDSSIRFGIITVVAGIVGTISGSALSKLFDRWTKQADCLVCALSLLLGAPLLYVALLVGQYNITAGWVTVFMAEFAFCLNWAPVANILLYVVVPERRSSAEAIQIFVIHSLGDAISPAIIGAISDSLTKDLSTQHPYDYSRAIGMQYALFLTSFVCVLGGGFFLWASLYVEEDRKAVIEHTKKPRSISDSGTSEAPDSMQSGVNFGGGVGNSETDCLLANTSVQDKEGRYN